jgi:hypothetical protein
MLEKTIQLKVLQYCKSSGIICFKVDSTSSRGLPDLTVVTPDGRVYFVELKTATGKLSKLQERFHNQLRENNANVAVIRSLDEFIAYINSRPD